MRFGIPRRLERRPASLSTQESGSDIPRTPVPSLARISSVILWAAALMAALVLAGANLPNLRTADSAIDSTANTQARGSQATPIAGMTPVLITVASRPHPSMRPALQPRPVAPPASEPVARATLEPDIPADDVATQPPSPLVTPEAPEPPESAMLEAYPTVGDSDIAAKEPTPADIVRRAPDSAIAASIPAPSNGGLVLLPTPTPTPTPQTVRALLPTPTPASTLVPTAPPTVPTPAPLSVAANAEALATPDGVPRSARVPILMYHYLSAPPPGSDVLRQDLSVSPDLFASHLDAMREAGYTAISLYDLLAYLTQGVPLPEKPVILTFDDGYRDNYENAFPLLRDRGMTATFFVVTDFIDQELPVYLTWDMAREMRAAGMSIESHGRNHVSLKNKDSDYLVWQALGSLETIQYELGVRPRFVSYPAGDFDQLTIDIFGSANYWAGVTTVQGATHNSDDLFRLQRVRVRGSTSSDELLRLLALDW